MLLEHSVQTLVVDRHREVDSLREITIHAVQQKAPLFVARFLTDMSVGEIGSLLLPRDSIVLRQYGGSCYVNAPPSLADALRAERGLDEAETALRSGEFPIVVLSQILNAVYDQVLRPHDVAALVDARPGPVSLILTGGGIPSSVVEALGLTDDRSTPASHAN